MNNKFNSLRTNHFLLVLSIISFFSMDAIYSQIKLGDNVTQINSKALLEMESSSQGVLLPRMNLSERDNAFNENIPDGLLIYNTDRQCLEIWQNTFGIWNCLGKENSLTTSGTLYITKEHRLILKDHGAINLLPYLNPDQQLSLEDHIIKLERGGSINLREYILKNITVGNTTNTDSQTLHLEESTNILSLENGGKVNLSKFLDDSDRDNQRVDEFEIRDGKLFLSLAGDGEEAKSVSLKQININTDSQTISLEGNLLSISGTTTKVDLSKYTSTDSQTLKITTTGEVTKTTLEINNGNAITLVASNGLKFQTTSTSLQITGREVVENLFNVDGKLTADRSIDLAGHMLSFNNNDIQVNGLNIGRGGGNQNSNVAIGENALLRNTASGRYNTSIGSSALKSNTLGGYNTAIGASTLLRNLTGTSNLAIGTYALKKNNSGKNNIAIGRSTLENNEGGDGNIAVGLYTLQNIVSGNSNTVIGTESGKDLTIGHFNTILGKVSGLASNTSNNIILADGQGNQRLNILGSGFVGLGDMSPDCMLSLHSGNSTVISATTIAIDDVPVIYLPNQDTNKFQGSLAIGNGLRHSDYGTTKYGTKNTAVGMRALLDNTSGYENTAVGVGALQYNISGRSNSAVGEEALFANTTGRSNTALGDAASKRNTSGIRNTSVGTNAHKENNTGSNNTNIGFSAHLNNEGGSSNVVVGSHALSDITSGSFNTIIGSNAGKGLITGNNNTIIGARVTSNTSNITNISNNIIIADGEGNQRIRVLADGKVGIGTQTPTYLLDVNGNINTNGDFLKKGKPITHPDYVFENYYDPIQPQVIDYRLLSLKEVEAFIKKNKHLPGVQSRSDLILNKTWNISENVRTNLEKVEELFLHTIEQQKKIENQQQEIIFLKEELRLLKKTIKSFLQSSQ